jgi:hypothetical protein
MRPRPLIAISALVIVLLLALLPLSPHTTLAVRVFGNHLVDANSTPITLIGVNRSGSEYQCISADHTTFDPANSDTPALISAMTAWGINAVRIPLNEDCWLGINLPHADALATHYRAAIAHYVSDLNAAGLAVILDLHWNAPGTTLATSQQIAPDADHAPAFWSSVAQTFRHSPAVLFDLYNEPHDISPLCQLRGCTTPGFAVAGTQTLLNAIRVTGATNVILVSGLALAATPPAYLPHDPAHQLAVSVHVYGNASTPVPRPSWLGLSTRIPVVTTELGDTDCTTAITVAYMTWANVNHISYLAWTWNAHAGWTCANGALIKNYQGTPTPPGSALRAFLPAQSLLH